MLAEGAQCEEAKGFQAFIFFFGLYLVALGSGCLKPNMISHGADQFRRDDPNQSKKLSSCFNTAYFSFCFGELVALAVLVWVQTHSGMDVGFGVSAAAMAMGLISVIAGTLSYRNKPPQGSILTPIAQVLGQGLHQGSRWGSHARKPMEARHCDPSGASEDNHLRGSDIRLHHHLQHHSSPAPNFLGPTRKDHGLPDIKELPSPTCFSPIHTLHNPHLPRAVL